MSLVGPRRGDHPLWRAKDIARPTPELSSRSDRSFPSFPPSSHSLSLSLSLSRCVSITHTHTHTYSLSLAQLPHAQSPIFSKLSPCLSLHVMARSPLNVTLAQLTLQMPAHDDPVSPLSSPNAHMRWPVTTEERDEDSMTAHNMNGRTDIRHLPVRPAEILPRSATLPLLCSSSLVAMSADADEIAPFNSSSPPRSRSADPTSATDFGTTIRHVQEVGARRGRHGDVHVIPRIRTPSPDPISFYIDDPGSEHVESGKTGPSRGTSSFLEADSPTQKRTRSTFIRCQKSDGCRHRSDLEHRQAWPATFQTNPAQASTVRPSARPDPLRPNGPARADAQDQRSPSTVRGGADAVGQDRRSRPPDGPHP